ncbi:hypothetical protein GTQ99_03545 [Kineococcus sp. T13]|uniref:hypothetical protein n=1 Tax=Kineococcus vitellinus TaxID=2696565 RepID=UPI00141348A2|nr:hypothetical protein [Kineococcus vitellinus]NAZ74498.1 hypothetical protein [Kineococcus vitellinus]
MSTQHALPALPALLAAAVAAGAFSGLRGVRRRRRAVRDDTLRVGQERELDPGSAALRAAGRNAWMRPGGGF